MAAHLILAMSKMAALLVTRSSENFCTEREAGRERGRKEEEVGGQTDKIINYLKIWNGYKSQSIKRSQTEATSKRRGNGDNRVKRGHNGNPITITTRELHWCTALLTEHSRSGVSHGGRPCRRHTSLQGLLCSRQPHHTAKLHLPHLSALLHHSFY